MPHIETIDFTRNEVTVPYKLTAWYGKGEPPGYTNELEPVNSSVHTARGWVISNIRVSWRGLSVRELRKGQFSIWRLNEAPNVFEGGVVDTFASDQLNALLAFTKDFDLDQNLIESNLPVYQQAALMTLDAPEVPTTTAKKGSKRG